MWVIGIIFFIGAIVAAVLGAAGLASTNTQPTNAKAKSTAKKLFVISAVLLLAAWLMTSVVTVAAGQVGVVTRFGAVTGRELGPGVSFKAPAPFESVSKLDTRVKKEEADATAASNDLQDVNGKIAVNWHLERGKVSTIYQQVGLDFEDKLLKPAIQESFKATTAQYTAQDLIKKRSEVGVKATEILNDKLQSYGIIIDSVNIINLEFSQAFTQAIEQSQVAAQQVVKAQNEVERVKKEAEAAIAEAQGKAEAQRQQAQSITPEYLELKRVETQQQAIAKWNGQLPTTTTGDSTLFNLPIK